MQPSPLGATGLTVSRLGLGAGHLGGLTPAAVGDLLAHAADLGLTLIDTAPGYGASEERIGEALAGQRARWVISTKGGYGVDGVADWTGEVITRGIDQALRRLRTDWLDVFHLHSCPLETLRRDDLHAALAAARAAGKIRVAAYSGENDALAAAVAMATFGSVQCSVNACDQRALHAQIPAAAARGVGVIGKRPLANAPWRWATRPVGDYAEVYWARRQQMGLAADDAPTEADTYLRFAAFAPNVSAVIVGTTQPAHLAAAAATLARGPLPADQHQAYIQAFQTHDQGWEGQI
jgi:aryl-alcohol dehydrogenase-like predicted oxidoreductase